MIDRALFQVAFSSEWGRQMRFITGPRQAGKTTLAKLKLHEEHCERLYYLWDLREVRNRYKENQLFFTADLPPASGKKKWVCFDEIHKIPKWKNALKAIFDGTSDFYHFVITGSAKFDLFRRAGDSLSGRYFTFHLFPLCLSELIPLSGRPKILPSESALSWIRKKLDQKTTDAEGLSALLEYSGFPEPFLKQSKTLYAKWRDDYADTVLKEDIGVLTRIIDKEHLYDLYHLLPEMVGSPLSENSLASHLALSNPTIKNYLKRLEDFYLAFKIHPYSKNVKRALLKAPKCYLYDWASVSDPAKRFENFVAVQLKAEISLWSEASEHRFGLFYVRNKEKEETDFLILRNKVPWLLIETKLTDSSLAPHHAKMQAMLGGIPLVQICREEGIGAMAGKNCFRMSASRLLS